MIKSSSLISIILKVLWISQFSYTNIAYSWNNLDSPLQSSQKGASELADLVHRKLKKEKSRVVFVALTHCDLDKLWCESFRSMFEHKLVQSGINFLPEEKADEVRQKIAAEGFYQHSSMMVDVDKAVELGKQESFQAFMSITVTGDQQDAFAKVQSISMKRAVVSISEGIRIRHKEKLIRPFSSYLSALSYTIVGAGVTHIGLDIATKEKDRADNSYYKYIEATDASEAIKYREKTKSHDRNVSYAKVGAVIGASVAFIGLMKFFHNQSDDYTSQQYKIEKADAKSTSLSPMFVLEESGSRFGFGLTWEIRR